MCNVFPATRAVVVFSLVVLVLPCNDLLAQTKPKRTDIGGEIPKSILWVGNSFFYYNNSMHNYLSNLV